MILTIPGIPFLGMRDSSEPLTNNEITQSKYIDDSHVTKHPRFECMEKHIRMRRGASVNSFIPLFKDKNTNSAEIAQTEPKPDFINIDSVTAGLGHCCLQVTTSTIDLDHARYVYDQLNIMSPIFMALSAGTPFLKGKLSDWDVRWRTISLACDDRNE
jgi:glutamate--cysteine ligase catalytic subunit